VYKLASERNGVRVAIRAVKSVARATRSCLAPQGVRSVWLQRRIDPAQARRKNDTMEDVSGRSSILSHWGRIPPYEGGRWNDPGHAGESDSARSRWRTGRQLPVGLEPNRLCPRAIWDVRGRDDFGEGSSSCRKVRRGAGGQHPERREALPCRMLGRGSRVRHGGLRGQRVHRIRIGRSGRKRIAALTFTGSGRANGSGPARAPTPNEGSR